MDSWTALLPLLSLVVMEAGTVEDVVPPVSNSDACFQTVQATLYNMKLFCLLFGLKANRINYDVWSTTIR